MSRATMRTGIAMKKRCGAAAALAALALGGCSAIHGFGAAKQPAQVVNANLYPANYRAQIATMLETVLTNRADYHALISPPMLKSVPNSTNQHYVVCLQYNEADGPKTKVVIYLGGTPIEYVDATPEECGGAPYQPFTELAAELPHKQR